MQAHRVVVIGAGFGGVAFVQALRGTGARITVVDRRNHHLFQPLLYQVATAVLSPADIAWPIRRLFRGRADVTTLMAEVTGVDPSARTVALSGGKTLPYDTLVIATGATHSYFGHDDWRPVAPPLKTVEDALEVRRRILGAFEQAELTDDPDERAALLTFAVIGGGPTGVELAGMIADIRGGSFGRDFRRADPRAARVFLLEGGPRILAAFPEALATRAARALSRRRVEARTGIPVTDCGADHFTLGQQRVACLTILWAAGVRASPAADWLGVAADRAGRVPRTVTPTPTHTL